MEHKKGEPEFNPAHLFVWNGKIPTNIYNQSLLSEIYNP